MKRFLLEITDELDQAIAAALEDGQSRNAAIESWLWRIGQVKQAAKNQGIERQPRRGRGRPARAE